MKDAVARALHLPILAQKFRTQATHAQIELKAAEMANDATRSRPTTSKSSSSRQSEDQPPDELQTALEKRKQFVTTRLEELKKLGVKAIKEKLAEFGVPPPQGKIKKPKLVAALSQTMVDKDIEQLHNAADRAVQQALWHEGAASSTDPAEVLQATADLRQKEAEECRGLERQEQEKVDAATVKLGKCKRKKKAQDGISRCEKALEKALVSLMHMKETVGCLEQTRARDAYGNKALHYVARSNMDLEALKLLMAVDLEQSNVSLAMLDATQSDALDRTVCGALNVKNRAGAQPLHLACENENVAVMMYIVSNKAKCFEVETRIREMIAKRWPWAPKPKPKKKKKSGSSKRKNSSSDAA